MNNKTTDWQLRVFTKQRRQQTKTEPWTRTQALHTVSHEYLIFAKGDLTEKSIDDFDQQCFYNVGRSA